MATRRFEATAAHLLGEGLVSRLEHLVCIDDARLSPETGGGRVLRIRVFGCLDVEILPERGLDIGRVWHRGMPVSWSSPIGNRSRIDAATGMDWLTRFNGGLVTTCGLDNIGPPRAGLGMHGGHSHQVATEVRWESQLRADGAALATVTGVIASVELFGRRVYAYRTITIVAPEAGLPSIRIDDTIRNEGVVPAPVALLYHVNLGAPTVMPGSRIHVEAAGVSPREPVAEVPNPAWMPDPTQRMLEAVFEYEDVRAVAGIGTVTVAPPMRETGSPSDVPSDPPTGAPHVGVTWSAATLPRLFQWVFPTQGGWALGLEPANAPMYGPDRDQPSAGVPVLEPGEELRAHVQVQIRA